MSYIAITRINKEVSWYSTIITLPTDWSYLGLKQPISGLIKLWGVTDPKDIDSVSEECTVYIFEDETFVKRLICMSPAIYETSIQTRVVAEVMDEVYRVFASMTLLPKRDRRSAR